MAMSQLQNLSAIDFENLCRDIAQVETGYRFSAFGPGRDGGIDGRYSKGEKEIILQCKHYIGSNFSNLKAAVKNETVKLSKLAPTRYILFTSQSLNPSRKAQLAELLGEYLKERGDIWGQEDIEDSLRKHPTIEKAHLKLWLGSTAVLEKILRSGIEAYTETTKDEILKELKIYARNKSFDEAISKLEEQKILVISGPPGVGKTTLAKMVTYYYLNEGWQFCAIRTLDEGFTQIDDETRTIFFFDDFLGRIELDRQSLLQRDSAFVRFVRRIGDSKNARFVLTTRAHIFEEARQISDYVDDQRFQLSKYLLDVSLYTRENKSYILYNHLSASNLTKAHFVALLKGNWLKKIIDHRNYNPRVLASVSSETIDFVEPSDYPKYLLNALKNPDLIWRKPFNALHLRLQNLLVALYFGSEYIQRIDHLRSIYLELHKTICRQYHHSMMPADFNNALQLLESGFISISGQSVSFVNPSLRDFLKSFLVEREFLFLLPSTTQRADWGRSLWAHVKSIFNNEPDTLRDFSMEFSTFARKIESTAVLRNDILGNDKDLDLVLVSPKDDLTISERVELLLEWWEYSGSNEFIDKALQILSEDRLDVIPQQDGKSLPEIHYRVRDSLEEKHPLKNNLIEAIVDKLVLAISKKMPAIDDLINVIKSVQTYMNDATPDSVVDQIEDAADYEFYETEDAISCIDSEHELSEYLEYLDILAELTNGDAENAKAIVLQRLSEIEEPEYEEFYLDFSSRESATSEEFSDRSMRSLFSSLLR